MMQALNYTGPMPNTVTLAAQIISRLRRDKRICTFKRKATTAGLSEVDTQQMVEYMMRRNMFD